MSGEDQHEHGSCQRHHQKSRSHVKKTVLFAAIDSVGHINSLVAIADSLRKRGHRTVFLFHEPIDCGLIKAGHEVYDCSSEGLQMSDASSVNQAQKWDVLFKQMDEILRNPTAENVGNWARLGWSHLGQKVKQTDSIFARKLDLIKPDVIIVDQFFVQPAILKYGKPWSLIFSPSPLGLHPIEHNLPPPFIGLPTNWLDEPDETLRQEYIKSGSAFRELRKQQDDEWKKYMLEEHQIRLEFTLVMKSPNLNVHYYPKELDYNIPLDGWERCDSILRINSKADVECDRDETPDSPRKAFEIPQELRDKPGKLIFLSMGTLASGNVNLMKRLVAILSKCPHRFIVSRGPNWQQYELGPNMWGEGHVDQLAVLPAIDLIITHGGNNTITECFYYGVPGFIVCPAFGDQRDNAQRIEECGFGKKMNPLRCTDQEFLDAIEQVLADQTIRPRMEAISKRMQLPENKYKAIRLFTKFVEGQN